MSYKVCKKTTFLWCVIIIFSFIGNSIVLSQDQNPDISDLENELKQTAEQLMKSDLEDIRESLLSGGYNITSDLKISAIPTKVRKEIVETQKQIKYLIIAAAKKIEDGHDFKIEIDEEGIGISEQHKEQASRISDAIKTTNISLSSYGIAVEYFVNMNKSLIDAAKRENDHKKKLRMYLTQAIYVYELSIIIMDMIDNFNTHGIEEIRQIHKEEEKDIANMINNIKKMDDNPQANGWLNALDEVKDHWIGVLSFLEKQNDKIEEFSNHKKRFERISQRAAMQIKVLEKTGIIKDIYSAMEAINTVAEIKDIPLLRLGKDEVLTLIGSVPIGEGAKDKSIKLN